MMWMKKLVILSREWNTMEFCQARMAMAMGPWLSMKLDLNQVLQMPESADMLQVRDCSKTEICNERQHIRIITLLNDVTDKLTFKK